MNDTLKKILQSKAGEVARAADALPLNELRAVAADAPPARGFVNAIEKKLNAGDAVSGHGAGAAVIAEIKKASPSAGVIRADFAPSTLARDLADAGAACLSVLTDAQFFQGRHRDLNDARAACSLPALRKDFIVDEYQIFESRVIGADAVLLIVAALGDTMLHELADLAAALGMDVLVEVHNADELARASALPCRLVGINNRDLRTFTTDINTTLNLLKKIPTDRIVVTESGLRDCADINKMRAHGVHTFLVGESLMRADDPGAALKNLLA